MTPRCPDHGRNSSSPRFQRFQHEQLQCRLSKLYRYFESTKITAFTAVPAALNKHVGQTKEDHVGTQTPGEEMQLVMHSVETNRNALNLGCNMPQQHDITIVMNFSTINIACHIIDHIFSHQATWVPMSPNKTPHKRTTLQDIEPSAGKPQKKWLISKAPFCNTNIKMHQKS